MLCLNITKGPLLKIIDKSINIRVTAIFSCIVFNGKSHEISLNLKNCCIFFISFFFRLLLFYFSCFILLFFFFEKKKKKIF